MSKTDIGDMAAVGTVLVTGSLEERDGKIKLTLYMPVYSNGSYQVRDVIQTPARVSTSEEWS